jgi:hypothetical protein
MTGTAMVMTPTPVGCGQQPIYGCEQVAVTSGPGFDDGHTRRGVRDEHRDQPVTTPLGEPGNITRQVRHLRMIPGPYRELDALHISPTIRITHVAHEP